MTPRLLATPIPMTAEATTTPLDVVESATMDTSPEYLTPAQAARLLAVSPKTVARWADAEKLPCLVTLGGHRRFRREVIEEAMEGMER